MKSISELGLGDVQAVYSGAEGDLWELLMGEQIHLGGLQSSMELADKAGLRPGLRGVDFCCCTGAGMRFLVRFRQAAGMTGVDATQKMVERGRLRCQEEGLDAKTQFVLGDVCASGLASDSADFIWGEDAWCYVVDKPKMISEAARIVKPGGCIAFTDWMLGPTPMSGEEAERYLRFMKFPNVLALDEYTRFLQANGCSVRHAYDTGRFPRSVALYLEMLRTQLTYDALKIIGFNTALADTLLNEMEFVHGLAQAGKIIQGLVVADRVAAAR